MDMMAESQVGIRTLDDGAVARWDQFVETCSDATFFHRAGWKRVILERDPHLLIEGCILTAYAI